MKKLIVILAGLIVVGVAAVVIWRFIPWRTDNVDPYVKVEEKNIEKEKENEVKEVPPLLTEQDALDIARKAWGKPLPEGPLEVKLDPKTEKYVVTVKAIWPKGTRGADYHAQITIDAKTGKVLKMRSS